MAYNELNRLKWTGRLADARVTIRHRGAPNDEMAVSGRDITEVRKTFFLYRNDRDGDEVHIPMHRILKIESEGRVLWQKRGKSR